MTAGEIACPACASQPGEPCKEWKDQVGMVPVDYFHDERVDVALWQTGVDAGGDGGSSHAASISTIDKAVDKLMF